MTGPGDFTKQADRFRAIAYRLRDLRPVLRVVAEDLHTFIDDRFDQQRDPNGRRWAPHAPSTLARRGPGAQILVDTGHLRASVYVTVQRTGVVMGMRAPYGTFHQTGTRNMPMRRILPVGRNGKPLRGGPAGPLWDGIQEAIRTYISTGRI